MDAAGAIEVARKAYATAFQFTATDGDAFPDASLGYGAPPGGNRGHWMVRLVQADRVGGSLTVLVEKRSGQVVWIGMVGE